MRGSTIVRVLFGLILIAGLLGMGALIYNTGVARGLAAGAQNTGPEGQALTYPPYAFPFYRPWGFGLFGLLLPLLFVFLFFLGMRGLFFRGWRHHHAWKGRGWRGPWQGDIPPMVEEWHRKMHAAGEEQPAPEE